MFSTACYAAKVFICQPHHPVSDTFQRPLCALIEASPVTLKSAMSELPNVFRIAVLRRHKFPISYDKWMAQQIMGRSSRDELLTNAASNFTLHMAVLECVEHTMLRKAPNEALQAVPANQKRGLGVLCKLTLSFCPSLWDIAPRVFDPKELQYLASAEGRCTPRGPGVGSPLQVSSTEVLRGRLGYLLSDEYAKKKYAVDDKIHQLA